MAKSLEDSDKRIADLARMFFTELATKDNAVYNQFVDMFSVLTSSRSTTSDSVDDNRDSTSTHDAVLDEDAVHRILKFLCGFIEKDKHAKNLAEKLAARLARCETERQWNDTAFALGLLQHRNEEISKKVGEGWRFVTVQDQGIDGERRLVEVVGDVEMAAGTEVEGVA